MELGSGGFGVASPPPPLAVPPRSPRPGSPASSSSAGLVSPRGTPSPWQRPRRGSLDVEPSDALREVVVRVARASTVNSGDVPHVSAGPCSPVGLSPPQEGGSEAAASEEEDDYRENLERLVETASSWDSTALADTSDAASRLPSGLARNATDALLGILEYTQRSDDATAAVLAGHVAYLVRCAASLFASVRGTTPPLSL